jgi:hypothetical protein
MRYIRTVPQPALTNQEDDVRAIRATVFTA